MSEHNIYDEVYKGYKIEILPDNDPQNPMEWDNIGTIATWHRRYNLGNVQPKQSPREFMIDLLDDVLPPSFHIPVEFDGSLQDYLSEWDDEKFHILFSKYFVYLPIYMYEHGGITINTGGFGTMFDTGQLGFIYISKKDFLKEMQKKGWTATLEQKAFQYLKSTVKTYNDYLTGNV